MELWSVVCWVEKGRLQTPRRVFVCRSISIQRQPWKPTTHALDASQELKKKKKEDRLGEERKRNQRNSKENQKNQKPKKKSAGGVVVGDARALVGIILQGTINQSIQRRHPIEVEVQLIQVFDIISHFPPSSSIWPALPSSCPSSVHQQSEWTIPLNSLTWNNQGNRPGGASFPLSLAHPD